MIFFKLCGPQSMELTLSLMKVLKNNEYKTLTAIA